MNEQNVSPVPNSCPKSRRLKVSYASTDKPRVNVPYLRLRGRWLKDAGFDIGRNVRIEVSEKRLMIEPVD